MFDSDLEQRIKTHLESPSSAVPGGPPGPAGPPPASISWNCLANAEDETAFCSAWLSLQCARIEGASAGLLVLRQSNKGPPRRIAAWPSTDHSDCTALSAIAERSLLERRPVSSVESLGLANGHRAGHLVAVPLGAGSQIIAAVAVRLADILTPEDLERLSDYLKWGAGWLETLAWARRLSGSSADFARAMSCLDLVALVGEQHKLFGAAIAIANDLAGRLRCDRVSVGLRRRRGQIRLTALSHSATFKNRSRVVDAIENAMEEAVDQRRTVSYPQQARLEPAI